MKLTDLFEKNLRSWCISYTVDELNYVLSPHLDLSFSQRLEMLYVLGWQVFEFAFSIFIAECSCTYSVVLTQFWIV